MSRTLRTAVVAVVVAAMASVAPSAALAGEAPATTVTVRGAIADYQLAGSAVQIVALANGHCRVLSVGCRAGAAATRTPSLRAAAPARVRRPNRCRWPRRLRDQVPAACRERQSQRQRDRGRPRRGRRCWSSAIAPPARSCTAGPLPDEVSSLAVSHGIAVLATVRHQGLYAVRRATGASASSG